MSETQLIPRAGMLAKVRNRFGLIQSVKTFGNNEGILHSVQIEYLDHETPVRESLIWEREVHLYLSEPKALPSVGTTEPMSAKNFEAVINASRWSAINPLFTEDSIPQFLTKAPISAPLFGSIKLEEFQLYPVEKALSMPRVSLLIADDTGLGKTIEAGLVISELILKRRIRKILILCPPNLRTQWRDELREKFGLDFTVLDMDSSVKYQREHGFDANPWRGTEKVISSFYYLKQPNIIEQFRAGSAADNSGVLPWDLLIVDEAHNLSPVPIGEPSDLYKMLKQVVPYFDHKVFLTATPHNGHTSSFTGLLELLDPVRIIRKRELSEKDKVAVSDIVVRRLKSQINQSFSPKRFPDRHIAGISEFPFMDLAFGELEKKVHLAFNQFKEAIDARVASMPRREQTAYRFALQVLQKRLLSCPFTFGSSWFRFLYGTESSTAEPTLFDDVESIRRDYESSLRAESDDDRETEAKGQLFIQTAGAWLRELIGPLLSEINGVTDALRDLGLKGSENDVPKVDSRFQALKNLIDKLLKNGTTWNQERILIFTEYKTTLDYLFLRLTQEYGADKIGVLFGQMPDKERETVKKSFNDSSSELKILVGTDTASEGLNLQEACRYLLHWDIPWNPTRLEQRNGRIDRHGQPNDVTIFHFNSSTEEALDFLSRVFEKVDQIKDDLGSVSDLFAEGITTYFSKPLQNSQTVIEGMDLRARQRIQVRRSDFRDSQQMGVDILRQYEHFRESLGFSEEKFASTIQTGLSQLNAFSLEGPDDFNRYRLQANTITKSWADTVDTYLRDNSVDEKGPLRQLSFSMKPFLRQIGERTIFRPLTDTILNSFSQPFIQKVFRELMQFRYPGSPRAASRWVVVRGNLPVGTEAIVVVYLEELANNLLRENIHQWIRPLVFGIQSDELILPHEIGHVDIDAIDDSKETDIKKARDIWAEFESDIKTCIENHRRQIQGQLQANLPTLGNKAKMDLEAAYSVRFGELGDLIKREKQDAVGDIEAESQIVSQMSLFGEDETNKETEVKKLEEEYLRRNRSYMDLMEFLKGERDRLINQVLPKRYTLDSEVKAFPVGIKIIFNNGEHR